MKYEVYHLGNKIGEGDTEKKALKNAGQFSGATPSQARRNFEVRVNHGEIAMRNLGKLKGGNGHGRFYYILENSKTTTAYGFQVEAVQSVPSDMGLVTGPFPRAEAAERLIRLQSSGWTTKWETPPIETRKCLYCGKAIENPNPEEEITSICDPCSEKDHEENP